MTAPINHHDQKPGWMYRTSAQKPSWLYKILSAQYDAREAFIAACDEYEDSAHFDPTRRARIMCKMQKAKRASEAADQRADFALSYWEKMRDDPDWVCDCPPQLVRVVRSEPDQYYDDVTGRMVINLVSVAECSVCGCRK